MECLQPLEGAVQPMKVHGARWGYQEDIMDILMVILRLIHIFAGVFWVGATFMLISFIQPTVSATGEIGQQFMGHLSSRTKFSQMMAGAGTLSLLSGSAMYYIIFGDRGVAINSGYGLSLTIGGIFGLVALILGFAVQYRSIARMKLIRAEMANAGGPPKPELIAELRMQAERLSLGTRIGAVVMTVALIGMSIAQYA
jgi:uncharacterized membrane protein